MTYLSYTVFKLQMSSFYLPFLRNTSCAVEAPREVPQVRSQLAPRLWLTLQSFPVLTPMCPEKLRGRQKKNSRIKKHYRLSSIALSSRQPQASHSELATQQLQMPSVPQTMVPQTMVPPTVPKTHVKSGDREAGNEISMDRQHWTHETTAATAQVVFKPRLPLGIFVSDVQAGRVSGVLDGQAKEQGLEAWGGTGGTGSRCGDDSGCRCWMMLVCYDMLWCLKHFETWS